MSEQLLILGDFADYIVPHEERPGEELWCERTQTTDGPGWHLVWRKKTD
jgi:hypothetical protein